MAWNAFLRQEGMPPCLLLAAAVARATTRYLDCKLFAVQSRASLITKLSIHTPQGRYRGFGWGQPRGAGVGPAGTSHIRM